jgi:hypothetical protein
MFFEFASILLTIFMVDKEIFFVPNGKKENSLQLAA